jgi:hypothetical protein
MQFKGMMVSMLGANQQELFLHSSMTSIIRADLAVLHRQKMGQLVSDSSTYWAATGLFKVVTSLLPLLCAAQVLLSER